MVGKFEKDTVQERISLLKDPKREFETHTYGNVFKDLKVKQNKKKRSNLNIKKDTFFPSDEEVKRWEEDKFVSQYGEEALFTEKVEREVNPDEYNFADAYDYGDRGDEY